MAGMDESRGAYRVLVAKLEEKRQLGRTRRRWEDKITMDLQEMWERVQNLPRKDDRQRNSHRNQAYFREFQPRKWSLPSRLLRWLSDVTLDIEWSDWVGRGRDVVWKGKGGS